MVINYCCVLLIAVVCCYQTISCQTVGVKKNLGSLPKQQPMFMSLDEMTQKCLVEFKDLIFSGHKLPVGSAMSIPAVSRGFFQASHNNKEVFAVDFHVATGTEVKATHKGRVRLVKNDGIDFGSGITRPDLEGCPELFLNNKKYSIMSSGIEKDKIAVFNDVATYLGSLWRADSSLHGPCYSKVVNSSNYVVIQWEPDGEETEEVKKYESMYNHLSEVYVRKDQEISISQVIGKVGATGNVTGPHLHYQVQLTPRPKALNSSFYQQSICMRFDQPLNIPEPPLELFPKEGNALGCLHGLLYITRDAQALWSKPFASDVESSQIGSERLLEEVSSKNILELCDFDVLKNNVKIYQDSSAIYKKWLKVVKPSSSPSECVWIQAPLESNICNLSPLLK